MASNPTAAPILFDRALLRARMERARRGGPVTFLLDRVREDMEERLQAVMRNFADVADIWTPGELLRKPVADRFQSITRIDLDQSETLPLQPQSLDLAVSALAFQFVNDLPGVLAQIRRALKPDGLLLAAMIGGDTLTELRQSFAAAEAECEGGVSPRVAPFADLRDIGALLQRAGLALPVTDVDRVVVRYDSAFALMADLRRMGATNILIERRRTPTRRATMLRMAQIYGERFADADGRIRATFDVIWLSGWAPHESQQKPLKPGSAKASLEAAVKKVKPERSLKSGSLRCARTMPRHRAASMPEPARGPRIVLREACAPARRQIVRELITCRMSDRSACVYAPPSHQQIDQMRDQRNVRGRHRVIAQLVGADPGQLLALARDRQALPAPADVERHQQMKAVIGVARKRQRRQARLADVDPDLLMQFADQRLLRPFAGLDLAAGQSKAERLPSGRARSARASRHLLCMGLFSRFCVSALRVSRRPPNCTSDKSIRCGISGMSAGGIG